MQLTNQIDPVAGDLSCCNRSPLKRGRIIEITHPYATLYFIYFTERIKSKQSAHLRDIMVKK
ncbi:hypothetical protein, partial [Paraglaciecola sp. 2405UD69-4]|uniref:hypothetical protein n=1 Tax=Paraglaciecola sp. 2405UD69-4 TaxID=3391836 RepID=UPI0039C93834